MQNNVIIYLSSACTKAGGRPALGLAPGQTAWLDGSGPHVEPVAPGARPLAIVEGLRHEGRSAGLMVLHRAAGEEVLVNGLPAWPVQPLWPGDLVRVPGSGAAFRVEAASAAPVAAAGDGLAGRPCGLCRREFLAEEMVWTCSSCGLALHARAETTADDDAEEACLQAVAQCPRCGAPTQSRPIEEDSENVIDW